VLLGIIIAATLYYIIGIYYGLHIDFKSGEYYKVLRETNNTRVLLYNNRIEVWRYIQPNLTSSQLAWIRQHWNDNKVYYIVDKNGNIWKTGHGYYPRATWTVSIIPLRDKLSMTELANAAGHVLSFDIYSEYQPEKCTYYNFSIGGYKPIVFVPGSNGGTVGQQVDWWVGKNTYWQESVLDDDGYPVYNITIDNVDDINNTIDVTLFWTKNSITYTSECEVPPGTNYISVSLDRNSYAFNTSLGPAIAIQHQLPDEADTYYFVYVVKFTVVVNSTKYNLTRVYYTKTIISDGNAPPQNPIARALWSISRYIKKSLTGLGKSIVNALKAVMPEQLKQLLSDVWQFFNTVYNIFDSALSALSEFADFFKLLAILIPAIAAVIAVHDPFLVPEFFMWLFDMMRKVVSFIRSLLPI
jgi:hypothetical protein